MKWFSSRACCSLVLVTLAVLGLLAPQASGGPLFGHPFATLPPGFVVHLAPIGPVPVPPPSLIGPIPFGDAMPNPLDPHHWEFEIHNPLGGAPFANDIVVTVPGGGIVVAGGLTLAPGGSAYWHITYPDVPEVGGPWFLTISSPATAPFFLFDSSVVEYNFPLVGPPGVGPLFAGAGGVFGGLFGVAPIRIDMSFTPIPEPTTLLAAAAVAFGMVAMRRRMRCKRAA